MSEADNKMVEKRKNIIKNFLTEIYPDIHIDQINLMYNPYSFNNPFFTCKITVLDAILGFRYFFHEDISDKAFYSNLEYDKSYIKRDMRKCLLNRFLRKSKRCISKFKSCCRIFAMKYTYKESKSESKISRIKRKM